MPQPRNPHGPHFSEDQFWRALGGAAKGAAALIAAVGVVWAALWWALQPRIDEYFDSRLTEFRTEISALSTQLTRIENSLPGPRPFVEFQSGGRVALGYDYAPGESLVFLYHMRRNKNCPTTVRAQFWSADGNTLAQEYTYDFSTSQPSPSLDFTLQGSRVRLPDALEPGHYSYVPVYIPDSRMCPGENPVQAPPSDFFKVGDG